MVCDYNTCAGCLTGRCIWVRMNSFRSYCLGQIPEGAAEVVMSVEGCRDTTSTTTTPTTSTTPKPESVNGIAIGAIVAAVIVLGGLMILGIIFRRRLFRRGTPAHEVLVEEPVYADIDAEVVAPAGRGRPRGPDGRFIAVNNHYEL